MVASELLTRDILPAVPTIPITATSALILVQFKRVGEFQGSLDIRAVTIASCAAKTGSPIVIVLANAKA